MTRNFGKRKPHHGHVAAAEALATLAYAIPRRELGALLLVTYQCTLGVEEELGWTRSRALKSGSCRLSTFHLFHHH